MIMLKFIHNGFKWQRFAMPVLASALGLGVTTVLHAQALGWEGETGVFVTPTAYTVSVEGQKLLLQA